MERCAPLVLHLPRVLQTSVREELKTIKRLNQCIKRLERQVEKEAKKDETVQLLMTVPAVGAVTATSFVAMLDDPNRFDDGHELASYLGIVPSETSSGERRVLGRITKAGPRYLRVLLVQVAHGILRSKTTEVERLKTWAAGIVLRRGKRIAVIALARKVAGLLLAIWKKRTAYDPGWNGPAQQAVTT